MNRGLRTCLSVSPLSVIKAVAQPSMIPVRLAYLQPASIEAATGSLFPDVSTERMRELLSQLYRNHAFYDDVNRIFTEKRFGRAGCDGFRDFLYLVLRLLEPENVVETGVWDGQGTAVMLQALADNDKGRLISIDLPATASIAYSTDCLGDGALPPGCQPGWTIPDRLRSRHELRLGDARELLPAILKQESRIDAFLHDSLHTYEHMTFEFDAAWPFIREGGVLMSHDIFDNPAFHRAARRFKRKYVRAFGTLGAMRR